MNREYWIRLLPYVAPVHSQEIRNILLLVPIQPRHCIKLGVHSQPSLGPAIPGAPGSDMRMEIPESNLGAWRFEDAVEHCRDQFSNFISGDRFSADGALAAIFLENAETLESVELGKAVIAPNNLFAVEVVIPETTYIPLIDAAATDVGAFYLLSEIGYQCFRTKILDHQPHAFREWFGGAITGRTNAPRKRPKSWINQTRNRLIVALVDKVESHGFNKTTNDATKAPSAMDVVAEGARRAKLRGVSSTSTVKDIFYNSIS